LPQGQESGLKHATKILKNIKNVVFTNFDSNDVIRHELVHKIIKAYETNDDN
jgi:phosphate starvation-inducible PhoH-like protein